MAQSIAQSPAFLGVPAPVTALQREHNALERLYIIRGQMDYLRAQVASARPNPTDIDYQVAFPLLERSYLRAVRDFEAARAQRATVSSTESGRSSPRGGSAALIPSVLGGGVLVVLLAVMATTAVRRARRRATAPPVLAERWQQVEQTVAELALEVNRLQESQRATETAWLQRTNASNDATTLDIGGGARHD